MEVEIKVVIAVVVSVEVDGIDEMTVEVGVEFVSMSVDGFAEHPTLRIKP